MKLIKSGLTFNQAIRQIIKNKDLLISRKGWEKGIFGKRFLNFIDWEERDIGLSRTSLKETEITFNEQGEIDVSVYSELPQFMADDFLVKDWQVWEIER